MDGFCTKFNCFLHYSCIERTFICAEFDKFFQCWYNTQLTSYLTSIFVLQLEQLGDKQNGGQITTSLSTLVFQIVGERISTISSTPVFQRVGGQKPSLLSTLVLQIVGRQIPTYYHLQCCSLFGDKFLHHSTLLLQIVRRYLQHYQLLCCSQLGDKYLLYIIINYCF